MTDVTAAIVTICDALTRAQNVLANHFDTANVGRDSTSP
jgi:hypothetical protein